MIGLDFFFTLKFQGLPRFILAPLDPFLFCDGPLKCFFVLVLASSVKLS